jgi:hypothetical protein
MTHTLEVYDDTALVFWSDGKWLHPLFDLEVFLRTATARPNELRVRDKIVGRGAALLIAYLGIGRVHAGVLSRRGQDVLDRLGIPYTYDELVERIACSTEELLREVTVPADAYALLAARAGRA